VGNNAFRPSSRGIAPQVTTGDLGSMPVSSMPLSTIAIGQSVIDWNIQDVSIDKLTVGTLTAMGTISALGGFQTAESPAQRVVIDNTGIYGYSDATTAQFYLLASDGKGYFGAGQNVLDSAGMTINQPVNGTAKGIYFQYGGSNIATLIPFHSLSADGFSMTTQKAGDANGPAYLSITAGPTTSGFTVYDIAGATSTTTMRAKNGAVSAGIECLVSGGVGTVTIAGDLVTGGLVDGVDVSTLRVPPISVLATDATNFTIAAGAATFEDDTTLDATIVPTVTSTLDVTCAVQYQSDTVRATALKFRLILDSSGTSGQTENLGIQVAASTHGTTVLGRFAGVAAGSHVVELQVSRVNAADTIVIHERFIRIVATPE
jgi:hypothetical protein